MATERYFVEHNGDCWQSVFPASENEKSQLHPTSVEALDYMCCECGVPPDAIRVIPEAR